MNIEISVKRQTSPENKPYMQKFNYKGDGNITVADWLDYINKNDAKTNRITWECGCLENKCGACAMLINGYPMLACSAFLNKSEKNNKIVLEPFSKFPVVKDLIADRSMMFSIMKDMNIWLKEKNWSDYSWDYELQYKAGQCIQCGCCLEICPNFLNGNGFSGAAAMINAYKAMELNINDEHSAEMKTAYAKKFLSRCGQSFSCKKVCPQNLPLDEIQARANHYQ